MQDYYLVPEDNLILEIGRDDWAPNPREDAANPIAFHFLTWEEDGSPSPDENEYETMEAFFQTLSNSPLDIVSYPVCRDEWGYLYELKTADCSRPVIGYLYQSGEELKKLGCTKPRDRAEREIRRYNQYISREVYFINSYVDGKINAYKNSVYDKEKELNAYEGCQLLGCFDCIEECMNSLPKPKPNTVKTRTSHLIDILK